MAAVVVVVVPDGHSLWAPNIFMWDLRLSAITELRLTSSALIVSLRRVNFRPSTGAPRRKGEPFRYLRLHGDSANNRHFRNVIFQASGVA